MVSELEKTIEVSVGDIVRLKGSNGNAVGYVCSISPTFIGLSQRDPSSRADWTTHNDFFNPGVTNYRLNQFDIYDVLSKKEDGKK